MKSKSHFKCPICFTANEPHINNYFICSECDSFYLFPIKSKDYVEGYWDAYYFNIQYQSSMIDYYDGLINENKNIFNQEVLEIGSGLGYFIRVCNSLSIRNMGVDRNRSAIICAKLLNNVSIDYMDVEDPFSMIEMAGKFKVKTICLYNVLEGFQTPVQTMKYIRQFSDKYIHLIVSAREIEGIKPTNFCMYSQKTIETLANKIDCNIDRIINDGKTYQVTLTV